MPSLRRCPVCDSQNIDPEGWVGGDGTTGPACVDCSASAQSVEQWNTRPREDRLARLAADMLKLLEEMPVKHPQQSERRDALRKRIAQCAR